MTRDIPLAFRVVAWALLAALAAPLVLIAIMSFNSSTSLAFPPHGMSLRWYAKILTTRSFIVGFGFSAMLAGASTAISVAIGTATAFALVRYRFAGRTFINVLVMAPLI